jgi:GNAT superfamily N-acetyltransferase
VLRDGATVLIRPLLYGDRFELAAAFRRLSPDSLRHRFLNAPEELDDDVLEYLTNLDYRDHFALGAQLEGGRVPEGVGVARFRRDEDDPTVAEVAVIVADAHQRRGIGTLLVRSLGEAAVDRGVRTFVSYVHWDNMGAIELLGVGARVTAAEPGVARIELDLLGPGSRRPDSRLRRVFATLARWEHAAGGRPDRRAQRLEI